MGQSEQNVLLHFWQLASPIFVPQIIDQKKAQREYKGYLLVIPEVGNLNYFVKDMILYWKSLKPELAGYRPRDALIDLPEEGGLEFLYHLSQLRIENLRDGKNVIAIELFHLDKQGNNVRALTAERLVPDQRTLKEYETIRDVQANHYYKALLIRNLLRGNVWYQGVESLFSHYPWAYFIKTSDTPRFPFFGKDVKRYFTNQSDELRLLEENSIVNSNDPVYRDQILSRRIYRLIGDYVTYKTDLRASVKRKDLQKNEKGHRQYTPEYREVTEKVSSDAFLAMRGRRSEDFIEYFTGTICAVPHFLPEDEFVDITHALIQDPDKVKNLAMLALSAHSWLPGKDDKPETISKAQEEGETP